MPGWQVRKGAANQVREDLLDDGVVAVLRFGLDQLYLELSRQPGL
jgi:hypothetical protein